MYVSYFSVKTAAPFSCASEITCKKMKTVQIKAKGNSTDKKGNSTDKS